MLVDQHQVPSSESGDNNNKTVKAHIKKILSVFRCLIAEGMKKIEIRGCVP